MIRYVSSFSVNTLHSMVNRGLLRMLCGATDEDIRVAATKSTVATLRECIPEHAGRVSFRSLSVNSRPGRPALLLRYLQSALQNVVELARSRKGDTIIYNFNNVFSIAALNFLSKRVLKGRRVITVCHGEMEYLDDSDSDPRAYKRLMRALTRRFFLGKKGSQLAPDFYFIVLGDAIKEELAKILDPGISARFESIDHPIMKPAVDRVMPQAENRVDGKINIGTVGIMNRHKGSETYLAIIEKLRDRESLSFSVAGQIQSDIERFKALKVRMGQNASEALPEEEFAAMVSALDYILLAYPADKYRLAASGALLDTLRFGKPLVAIKTPYFKYFFEKFGAVGYLVKDAQEMTELIEGLDGKAIPEFDYEVLMAKLSPEALTPRLKEILRLASHAF